MLSLPFILRPPAARRRRSVVFDLGLSAGMSLRPGPGKAPAGSAVPPPMDRFVQVSPDRRTFKLYSPKNDRSRWCRKLYALPGPETGFFPKKKPAARCSRLFCAGNGPAPQSLDGLHGRDFSSVTFNTIQHHTIPYLLNQPIGDGLTILFGVLPLACWPWSKSWRKWCKPQM